MLGLHVKSRFACVCTPLASLSTQIIMPIISENVHVVTGKTGYQTQISTANHHLVADESVADGGTDAGPGPFQYLLAALGSCTSITLRMYADRKGWPLEQIAVDLQLEDMPAELGKNTRIHRKITLTGPLTTDQQVRLLQVANACPVHKILTGNITVETSVQGAEPVA